jgi:hypothetical protein
MDNKSFFEMYGIKNKLWKNKIRKIHRSKFINKLWKNKAGKLHRLNGPAIEYANGEKEWFQNGLLHRLDGPAIEYANGAKEWCQNGLLHRLDGPAIIRQDGSIDWFKYGKHFENKNDFFESLTEEEKTIALFSKDFFNG